MAAWSFTLKRGAYPRDGPVASMKLKPEGVPRHLGQQDVTAYFPHRETAVTEILEGQLAFLQHVHLYEENHRGTHILQPRLLWKYEFRCCFMGCLSSSELEGLTQEIFEWAHSMDDEQWSMIPSAMQESKVTVSEWLLNSTSAAYLLNDRDYDSHTPLLIEVHALVREAQRER